MIQLNYQLTANDYLEAAQADASSSKQFWSKLLNTVIFLWLGFINIKRSSSYPNDEAILYWVLGFLCIGISLLYSSQIFPKYNFLQRKLISRKWQHDSVIQEPKTIAVTETELMIQAKSFRDSRQWQSYDHFVETNKLFLLYYSKNLFHIFPKRIFSNEKQLNQFRNLIAERVKKVK